MYIESDKKEEDKRGLLSSHQVNIQDAGDEHITSHDQKEDVPPIADDGEHYHVLPEDDLEDASCGKNVRTLLLRRSTPYQLSHLDSLYRKTDVPSERLTESRGVWRTPLAFSDFMMTLWPWVFYGLLTNDFIEYFTKPEDRYGNTWLKILAGESTNQLTLSSQVGSDLVMGTNEDDAWHYWLPLITMTLPLVFYTGRFFYLMLSRCFTRPLAGVPGSIHDEMRYLSTQYELGFRHDLWRAVNPFHPARNLLRQAEYVLLEGMSDEREEVMIVERLVQTLERYGQPFQIEVMRVLANIVDSSRTSTDARRKALNALQKVANSSTEEKIHSLNKKVYVAQNISDLSHYRDSYIFFLKDSRLIHVSSAGNTIENLVFNVAEYNDLNDEMENAGDALFPKKSPKGHADEKSVEKSTEKSSDKNPLAKSSAKHSEEKSDEEFSFEKSSEKSPEKSSEEKNPERISAIPKKYFKRLQGLISSNADGYGFLAYLHANYLLWTLNKNKKLPFSALFWLLSGLTLYAKIMYLKIVVLKWMSVYRYFNAKDECEAVGNVYQYLVQLGNYACMVCPDWDFVPFSGRNDPQVCLDGLTRSSLSSLEMITALSQLARQASFNSIALPETWTSWNVSDLTEILNQLLGRHLRPLQTLNLSCSASVGIAPSTLLLQALADFFQQVDVLSIDFRNCAIPGSQVRLILSSLVNKTTEYINLDRNNLRDVGAAVIGEFLPLLPFLRTLIVSRNQITNDGFQDISRGLANSTVNLFDANTNLFDDAGIGFFARLMPLMNLHQLILSNNRITAVGLLSLFKALEKALVEELSVGGCAFGDGGLLVILPYLQLVKLTLLDISNNQLTARSGVRFFASTFNSTITTLIAGNNHLGDVWAVETADILDAMALRNASISLQNLAIPNNGITSIGFGPLIARVINATQLTTFNIANNLVGVSWIPGFILAVQSRINHTLSNLDISNIGLQDHEQFFETLVQLNLMVLRIAQNLLTSQSASGIARLIANGLTFLDLSKNKIDGAGMSEIGAEIPDSSLDFCDASDNPIGDDGGVQFAINQVPAIPNRNTLGDAALSLDQSRLLSTTTLPTQLVSIILNRALLGDNAMRALCRMVTLTQNSIINFQFVGNLNDPLTVNNQSCQISAAGRQIQRGAYLFICLIYTLNKLANLFLSDEPILRFPRIMEPQARPAANNATYARSSFSQFLNQATQFERAQEAIPQTQQDTDIPKVSHKTLRFG